MSGLLDVEVAMVTGRAGGIGLVTIEHVLVEGAQVVADIDDVAAAGAGVGGGPPGVTESSARGVDGAMTLDTRSVVPGHESAAWQFTAQGTGGSITTTAGVDGRQGGWFSLSHPVACTRWSPQSCTPQNSSARTTSAPTPPRRGSS